MTAAKFYVGILGAVLQAALQFIGPDNTAGHVISVILAVVTALGVYIVPNQPKLSARTGTMM